MPKYKDSPEVRAVKKERKEKLIMLPLPVKSFALQVILLLNKQVLF